jgi:hypothetical protein
LKTKIGSKLEGSKLKTKKRFKVQCSKVQDVSLPWWEGMKGRGIYILKLIQDCRCMIKEERQGHCRLSGPSLGPSHQGREDGEAVWVGATNH